jgi:molybdopterin-binding protein
MRIDERRVAHGKGTLWAVVRGKKTGKVQVNAGTGIVLTNTDSKRVVHAEEIKQVESKVDMTQI